VSRAQTVPKLRTGIPGFDNISEGGLPHARATLIAGTAGSAKTVFATHFLASGIINENQAGVFVTFEDRVEDIRANMLGFGWDIAKWEKEGKWMFVDAAPDPEEPTSIVGSFDLSGLLSRVEHAIRTVGAKRISLDSLNALFVQFPEHPILRAELFRITTTLKRLGVTVVFTGERVDEYGDVTRHGIEEFVADNVIILRNLPDNERRRRTIEILKLRGAPHQRGEFPFTITSRDGIIVIPLSGIELTQTSSTKRVTSGVLRLDEMCGVVNRYPHAMAMEDHLVEMQQLIHDYKPTRVAVDSLSALERVSSLRSFREFVISLTSFLKQKETVGLFTSTTPSLLGGGSVTEKHISTLTDSIILLRYVESFGVMLRSLVLLKMRGSLHDAAIRQYTIDGTGMHIGEPFEHVVGILSGNPTWRLDAEDGEE
jgi:KaiC/GvpD/RAD55 family RecA-like ATPase